jgi:hypothetical protein
MSVYVNTDVSRRFFCDRYLLDYFVVEDLELAPDIMAKHGERLRELSGETTYYENFDDVLNDFKSLGFSGDNIEDLNEYLGKFNIRVHEFDSQE